MNVLLLSMPDSFEHMPPVAIRMPNGALASLAGNVDPHHRVAIADLILVQSTVRATVERLVRDIEPDVVGLSVMTFQRAHGDGDRAARAHTPARRRESWSAATIRAWRPTPTTPAPRSISSCAAKASTRCASCCARSKRGGGLERVAGLSYRTGDGLRPQPRSTGRFGSQPTPLRLPNRDARVLSGYTLLGRRVDVVETSRGCTFDCSFCSIIEMRGRNFHPYPIERVLADIADARAHGAEAIFLVDDNITLDVKRFEQLCHAIVDAGFDDSTTSSRR